MAEAARWGPFELLHRVEAGPMLESWVALRRAPNGSEQRVWLERVSPKAGTDVARLVRERAEAASRLTLATVVRIIDHGEIDGETFVASKLVDGMDPASMLRAMEGRSERFELAAAIFITSELARALQHAHHARVVHGDVLAGDTRIGFGGEVKLGGFAIAAARATGKPGGGRGDDAAGDLLGLGVVAHQLLTGRRPADRSEGASALHHLEVVDPSGGATTMAFAGVVERLLEPDAAVRLSSAGLLVAALGAFEQPEDLRRMLGTLVRRHMSTMVAPRLDAATLARLRTALGPRFDD